MVNLPTDKAFEELELGSIVKTFDGRLGTVVGIMGADPLEESVINLTDHYTDEPFSVRFIEVIGIMIYVRHV